ncbi:hypothetical protein [Microcella sp.]|uniref:hypothetical protein n=1 Tax=Microcella sp. TaxID=1913979 RepID=UPI0025661C24|nr:hypothetical protein [Microcella sp.]MBX9470412.1 hypothetical protein [Microcella sp.]
MATVSLDATAITVRLTLLERVLAVHGSVTLPLHMMRSASSVPDGIAAVRGIRAPGLGVPWWAKIGTWRRRGSRTLAVVRGRGPALHLQTSAGPISQVLVSTPEADALAQRVQAAIAGAGR